MKKIYTPKKYLHDTGCNSKASRGIIQVTKEAGKTKETARQFLIDAGILRSSQEVKQKNKKK